MINKEKEQCSFVNNATREELLARIKEDCLLPEAEVTMLKKGKDSISCFYINRYGLCEAALKYIFSTSNKKLLFAIIEKLKCNYTIVNKLISCCRHEVVDEFFDTHSVINYPEFSDNIDFNSQDAVINYLKTKGMSSVALTMAIRAKNLDVLKFICERASYPYLGKKGEFRNGRACLTKSQIEAIARIVDEESLRKLMMIYNIKTYKFLYEIYMFRFVDVEEVKKYILRHSSFSKEGKSAFFDCANLELVVFYFSHRNIEDWDVDLIRSSKINETLFFLKTNWLSKRGEKVLLERNHEDEISSYIENHYFGYEEVLFVRICSHFLLMKYVERHSLSDKAQVELLKRGNIVEIFAYVTRHGLCEEAENILFGFESDLLFDAWFYRRA